MPFIRRTSKTYPTDMWNNENWYSSLNKYYDYTYMLPNCTCYTYGRLLELGCTNINLCNGGTDNAGNWYGYNDGYQRSQTPVVGAVACWYSPSSVGSGHVAIVEEVNGNQIITSNSNLIYPAECGNKSIKDNVWNLWDYWYERVLDPPYSFLDYVLQGFIIVPFPDQPAPPEPADWISGNRFLDSTESDSNAVRFYYVMSQLGFSYNSILAMLANIKHESTINPGIWEGLDPYAGGYGLVQWTPYTKYSDWAGSGWEDNGDKECERIYYESRYGIDQTDANQWFYNPYAYLIGYPSTPPITFYEFSQSYISPKVLADYWLLYYEHPAESNLQARSEEHQSLVDYYNTLLGGGSPTPPSPTPTEDTVSKLVTLCNKRKFMQRRGNPWR